MIQTNMFEKKNTFVIGKGKAQAGLLICLASLTYTLIDALKTADLWLKVNIKQSI